MYQTHHEHDEIRGRFTNYLQKLVIRAKKDYLNKKRRQQRDLYLEDLGYEPAISFDLLYEEAQRDKQDAFQFEEERLAEAFYSLPLLKRRVLELLFVEGASPSEVANRLNCSAEYVSSQRYRALKKLRKELEDFHG